MNRRTLAVIVSAALLGACNDNPTVNDLNNVSAETIKGGLTTASAQLLTSGLLNQYRNSATGNWITFPETMARDAMRLDKAESRYVSEIIGGTQPDYSAFTGGGAFTGFFTGIRSANTLIDAATAATPASSGMSTAELSSLVGLGQTMKALMYWNVMETRDTVGMPIALNVPIDAPLAAWCGKASVYAYISALLDSANTALLAGGAAFPVTLPTGYRAVAGTPAGFAQFNRGLKAKVELYRGIMGNAGSLAAAQTAIAASFMQTGTLTSAGMNVGVFQNYSTAPGESTNSRVDNALHLNPAIVDSAQAGDLRLSKVVTQTAPYTLTVGSTVLSTKYDYVNSLGAASLIVPLAILRNEELLLLRAQIAIEQNDMVNATLFLNYVRQNSGGLAPYAGLTQTTARNALLYEKRYSLLMEGPQRLVDLRAYGRFGAATWPKGASSSSPFSSDVYTKVLPVPLNEVSARGGTPPTAAASCP